MTKIAKPPPHLYFVGSAIFHYLGPSFAVLLFAVVPVAGVAWLRIVSAGLVFAIWRRPWRVLARSDATTRWLIVGLGAVFAVMNYSFYLAIDALPLGTVAAIEFVGPIVLALAGTRSARNLAAVVLAMGGVWVLTDVRLEGSTEGFVWAFVNAVLFTAYIVLAHRLARAASGASPIDRLGASMLVAAVAITPLGISSALPAFTNAGALAAGIGVGVSSSVIPYVLDQLAMQRLPRETYSLFVSLLPATAVVVGVIVLQQIPTAIEVAGVALVILGVGIHAETRDASEHAYGWQEGDGPMIERALPTATRDRYRGDGTGSRCVT
jgi:inner membrane transporter RhtA